MKKRPFKQIFILVFAIFCLGAASVDDSKVVFKDSFDSGKLDKSWSWLRENPETWRIKDKALEIRVEPGVARNVKNALLIKSPDRSKGIYAVEVTVFNHTKPTIQYEQAGITLYHDGKPIVKLVKELIDGKLHIIPGKIPMDKQMVQLRMIITKDGFTSQFRPDGKGEFNTAGKGKLPPPGDDRISIQCYNGPPDAEHWIRFDDFRIIELSE